MEPGEEKFKSIVTKIIAQFFLIALMVLVGVFVMIYGWGIEPKNWFWIIGGGVFMQVFLRAVSQLL